MKRISGGQTSVKARGQAPIKSRRLILGRRRATQRITVTPASKPGRSTASYRVSPPPARGPTNRVGRHRPSARTLTQRPVMRDDRLEGPAIRLRFPVAFRPPAAEVGCRRGARVGPFPTPPSRTRREPFSSPGSPATIPRLLAAGHQVPFWRSALRIPLGLRCPVTCAPSPCGRLSRPPWCGVTRTTTMGTPSPWGSRPVG